MTGRETGTSPKTGPKTGLSGPARLGMAASLGLLVVLGVWMQTTRISGAVIAPGEVVVHGDPRPVQSLDGGTVAAIGVADGDRVAAGEVLMRLDRSLLEINRDIARTRLAATLAEKSRLEAELQGREEIAFADGPPALDGVARAAHRAGQRGIFAARREVRAGRRAQLARERERLETRKDGTAARLEAAADQRASLAAEIGNLAVLREKGLTPARRLSELERRRADLDGRVASLRADLAGLENSVRETRMKSVQADREFREGVVTDLRAAHDRAGELLLEIARVENRLTRTDIRAPVAGIVHEMQVTAVGGVVAPEQTILKIVPLGEGLAFELRVAPREIDSIAPGQGARLRLPAFDRRTTPELDGRITRISPDTLRDAGTGRRFYRVGVRVPPAERARLGDAELLPGMPVEAFLTTPERTVLSYLLHPLTEQMAHAFREG